MAPSTDRENATSASTRELGGEAAASAATRAARHTVVIAKARSFASLVAFSHTVFALPFAGAAALLTLRVAHAAPTAGRLALMLACMVSARTAAMAFNRYVDRAIDARNPRTARRELPSGAVSPVAALALTIGSSLAFLAFAAALGPYPGWLALPVLAVLLGYSLAKRATWSSHLILGLSLALAPGGVWIAMGATPGAGIISLMLGVLTWVAGFDVLYSLQDQDFDRREGLHSIPARFGTTPALVLSAVLHVIAAGALVAAGVLLQRGVFYFAGCFAVTLLLAYEHALVGRGDLSKIDKAFFDINGYVGLFFFALTAADAWRLS